MVGRKSDFVCCGKLSLVEEQFCLPLTAMFGRAKEFGLVLTIMVGRAKDFVCHWQLWF